MLKGLLRFIYKLLVFFVILFILMYMFMKYISNDHEQREQKVNVAEKCKQSDLDSYYSSALHRECFVKEGMNEYKKAAQITGYSVFEYKKTLDCPITSLNLQKEYQNKVESSVLDGINRAGSVKVFCENELEYFNKILKKYN